MRAAQGGKQSKPVRASLDMELVNAEVSHHLLSCSSHLFSSMEINSVPNYHDLWLWQNVFFVCSTCQFKGSDILVMGQMCLLLPVGV